MNIIATSEFWALVFVIAGLYTAIKILAARREINATNKKHQDDEQAKQDEAQRRRMVHEADYYNEAASMEPPFFPTPSAKEEFFAQAEANRQARSREAVRRAQFSARVARHRIEFEKEKLRKDEIRQHNSTFRALGVTPVPEYDEDPKIEWERDLQQAIETGLQEERARLFPGKS